MTSPSGRFPLPGRSGSVASGESSSYRAAGMGTCLDQPFSATPGAGVILLRATKCGSLPSTISRLTTTAVTLLFPFGTRSSLRRRVGTHVTTTQGHTTPRRLFAIDTSSLSGGWGTKVRPTPWPFSTPRPGRGSAATSSAVTTTGAVGRVPAEDTGTASWTIPAEIGWCCSAGAAEQTCSGAVWIIAKCGS